MKDRKEKILEKANKLIFVKQYDEAATLIEDLILDPEIYDDILVHLRRIELATKRDQLPELRNEYFALLEKNPNSYTDQISLCLVEQHGEMADGDEIIARVRHLLSKSGTNSGAYYCIAFCAEVKGDFDQALKMYEQCVETDPSWYPGYFGMSQIFYQSGDDPKGDYFFNLFEESAPFNVYGNFDTHRRLSAEFLEDSRFTEAEIAIETLTEWWVENRGICPPEIQVYESFALAKIHEVAGKTEKSTFRSSQGLVIAKQLLEEDKAQESVLYFVAKTLEEFDNFDMAFQFYKKILSRETSNPEMVQKIGGQFLSLGEHKLAKELFEEAYKQHPDNMEIRFCRLIACLKIEGINVEEYLVGKERMKNLMENPTDKVELLSLLHSLMAKFKEDPDVQGNIGEVYLRLGNIERAAQHYRRMYELDELSKITTLRYAAFEMQYGSAAAAKLILEKVAPLDGLDVKERTEVHWLNATYYHRQGDYTRAQQHLAQVQAVDPWNVLYLVQEVSNYTRIADLGPEYIEDEKFLASLLEKEEGSVSWGEFDERTKELAIEYQTGLVYTREKVRYLFTSGEEESLKRLVKAGCSYDASRSTFDFLRLLNTNYDGPHIYWALGILFKELWQLETASMWFEQILVYPNSSNRYLAKAYVELADCYNWRGVNPQKSIEFVKLAIDLGTEEQLQTMNTLAYAFLKSGDVKQAQAYLEDREDVHPTTGFEVLFLRGLVQYRNGAVQEANKIWKPLLTVRSDTLRTHNIKQEIMKFYFDKKAYLQAN